MQIVDSQVRVVGYSIPALEGSDITLSCPSGEVLTGHNGTSAMCMQNGNWEPDIREAECKGNKNYAAITVISRVD